MSNSDPAARRAAALAAIEARQLGSPESPSSTAKVEVWVPPSEKDDAESRKTFARLLDRGIVRDNGYKQSYEAVEVSASTPLLDSVSGLKEGLTRI